MGSNIADLANGYKTHLTIVDAYRVMMRNGPVGGRLSDVELKKTVVASVNIMETDVVSADVFGVNPLQIEFIQAAAERKMGQSDLKKINVRSVKI